MSQFGHARLSVRSLRSRNY